MRFDIITIFPQILDSYFQYAQIKRAIEKNAIEIHVHNLRDFTEDKHKTVDDVPYGGGAGMVMKIDPIYKNVDSILKSSPFERKNIRIILLSAKGGFYSQKKANNLAKKYKQIIFICGRYEGIDERVSKHIADEEICIGPYVLSGGEIGAGIIIDSITRLLPNVIGNSKSLDEESFVDDWKEYPQYTRPPVFNNWEVPEELLSGNHKLISDWRKRNRKEIKLFCQDQELGRNLPDSKDDNE